MTATEHWKTKEAREKREAEEAAKLAANGSSLPPDPA